MDTLTLEVARKVLTTVDVGLVRGKGIPEPGKMCVEAAVCYALGLPHSDEPPCVGSAVRRYKINLNDSHWSSDAARTKGMRRIAIAQLGSNEVDQRAFADYVVVQCVRRILPIALRAAASLANEPHKAAIEATIPACENASDYVEVTTAAHEANKVTKTAYSAAAAAAASSYSAYSAYAAAAAAAYSAYSAAAAAYSADASDEVLSLAAEIAVEALQKLNCQGCQWLYLCDEGKERAWSGR